MRWMVDAHLDLGWNALGLNRPQDRSLQQLRLDEQHMSDPSRGSCMVSLPQLRQARVSVCLATVISRVRSASQQPAQGYRREALDYADPAIAYAIARGQAAYYEQLQRQGLMKQLRTRGQLLAHHQQCLDAMPGNAPKAQGYILAMEGADAIVEPNQLVHWWEMGLRTLSLAHYGPGRYAMGTGSDGPLTERGRHLLEAMQKVGMILDLAHTADLALEQAMDLFGGPVFVSHANCRALVDSDRQMTDAQIKAIAQRGGVVGVVMHVAMLVSGWVDGQSSRCQVTLERVADHLDHLCQVAGSVDHAALGSDLDGGFGTEHCPADLDCLSDLHKLESILSRRGYRDDQIDAIFFGNWIRFFAEALPEN